MDRRGEVPYIKVYNHPMAWELDEQQREAVECMDRAVMVVAGPGTGKTRVLTARVVWLTETEGVDPSRILAITYTNRATAEMRGRLAARLREQGGSPAGEVAVSTFHAWAYKLVRKYAEVLGFPHEPVVFDEDAQEQLLRRLLGEKRIPEEAFPIRNMKQLLDRVKADIACPVMDERFDPEHYETVSGLFKTYQEELQFRGAVDFADILLSALRLLYVHPDIRAEIIGSIDHLLIDEFQDINSAQYRLIESLHRPGMNLFAVGDEDQTIYAFRGSSGVFIDQFVADFGARLIPLGTSYRCSNAILYAAGSLISKNRRFYQQAPRPPKEIRSSPPLGIFELENEDEEGSVVTKLIRSWASSGCSYRDIAILYRVHSLADECESILINNGIPVLRLLKDRHREEIPGDPLPLLRLAAIDTEWDWDRAIGLPRDRLGELDDLRVRLAAKNENVPLHRLLARPSRFKKLSALAGSQLAGLSRFVTDIRKKTAREAPSALINLVATHLSDNRSPWYPNEDAWLEGEEKGLGGFDRLSPGPILEEWRQSKEGLRIFHAPTITAFLAARMLHDACEEILGVKAEMIPLPLSTHESARFPVDNRPACVVGLDWSAERFFPTGTLLPRALYVTSVGVSDSTPESFSDGESFPLALAAHRLAASLVSYRPGGGEDEILVFFDLETTGTEIFRAEIVEIAAIKVLLKGGEIRELGHFHSMAKPRFPIPAPATAVHGITDEDVSDAPSCSDILPRFLEFIGDAPLAGHNIDSYDMPLLRRHVGGLLDTVVQNLTLDTLTISRRLFPGEPHSLGVMAERLGVGVERAHRALDDVRTNIALFGRLMAIDEEVRARSFSHDIPVIFAVAHAVDESTDIDSSFVEAAARRGLARHEGEIEDHPFILSLKDSVTSRGLSTVLGVLRSLARGPYVVSESDSALEARVQMLREEALRLEDERPGVTLGEFLAHIALLTDGDFDSDEDAVRMMTLHAAKGLEFDRVIILGLEQGNLPHRLALNKTVAEIEEERRLCYVGITRARKRAALMYVRRRFGRWRNKSMFLFELPRNSYKTFRTKDRVSGE